MFQGLEDLCRVFLFVIYTYKHLLAVGASADAAAGRRRFRPRGVPTVELPALSAAEHSAMPGPVLGELVPHSKNLQMFFFSLSHAIT